jgi:hypothetical protein
MKHKIESDSKNALPRAVLLTFGQGRLRPCPFASKPAAQVSSVLRFVFTPSSHEGIKIGSFNPNEWRWGHAPEDEKWQKLEAYLNKPGITG